MLSAKTLFHESVWLDFMLATKMGTGVDYFEILRNRTTVGYFCALRIEKFFVSQYRNAWFGTTVFQGPVIDVGKEDQFELVSALMSASMDRGVDVLQMRNDWLDKSAMQRLGFNVTAGKNHVCPLQDETSAWNAMRGTCRTRIRKSEKEGLVAEATTDVAIADDFHSFYRQTLETKGLVPAHDAKTYRTLMSLLAPADRLFAVVVKDRDKTIAAGFYAYDERAMYFLDGAGDPALRHLCPNELMHWTAMKTAIRRGIPAFNIGGGPVPSRFSEKFGGESVPYHEFSRALNPLIRPALALYDRLRGRA